MSQGITYIMDLQKKRDRRRGKEEDGQKKKKDRRRGTEEDEKD